MKKVLILSYYFPPCNMTPSERIYSWAKYLKQLGYYPIIVTRNWDFTITGFSDELKSSGTVPIYEKFDDYEVWYMPYKQSFKESLFTEQGNTITKTIYLFLSLWTNLLQVFTYRFSPLRVLYHKTEELIKTDKDIDQIIVSAYPYALFKFAYDLNKKYAIDWIADYRDDWTSNEILNKSPIHRFLNRLNAFNEKKWLSTAKCFITVSDYYVEKIKKVIGQVKGYTIQNGYMPENYQHLNPNEHFDKFTITYVGSLYHTQPIELFLLGVKTFIDTQNPTAFRVLFVGLKNNKDAYQRVCNEIKGYEAYFEFTERVNKMEAIDLQHKSNVLLICTHTNMKGTPGSKLYEYIALKKLVLITPGDKDIVEATLSQTNQAIVAPTDKEVCKHLIALYRSYTTQDHKEQHVNLNEIKSYDRYFQTERLGNILNNTI